MNFDNSLFDDIPIEFKKINPEDFDETVYNVQPKEIIKPDDDGFLSKNLLPILESDFQNKNTTVINAGVGQGKTRAIIEVLTKFADNPEYIICIAVPYKSLIEQYLKDCSAHISKNEIFNLIGHEEDSKKKKNIEEWGYTDDEAILPLSSRIRGFKVHIMTINALLGNPGDDNLFVSRTRSEYFTLLNEFCESANKKMIWLFDEIHDSIHNFKEPFIYNLWNFHGLVHKTYVVSATFNEASKEVIKYLSEFTDKNIFIIESERTPTHLKQSNLHLNFYIDHQLYKDANLVNLVSKLIKNKKPFDILVYSKSLAEKLINPNKTSNSKVKKVSDVLKNKTHIVNRCFSDAFNPKANKKYDKTKINIGTNFSTGINIEKLDHTLIILFPKDLSVEYVNNKGVFTNGSNVIIQALARQRKKGNIYVFLPNPDEINLESLPYDEKQNKEMHLCFEKYKRGSNKKVNYSKINSQDTLLENAYDKLIYDTTLAKQKLDAVHRDGLNRLMYPTKEIFILNQGEKYITKEFFGGNLSAYILWASVSNQFLNCSLKGIKTSTRLNFDKDNLESDVEDFLNAEIEVINSALEEYNLFDSLSEYEKLEFINQLLVGSKIYINDNPATTYEKDKVHLLMIKSLYFSSENFSVKEAKSKLYYYYLRSSICHSGNLHFINDNLKTRDLTCVKIFKKWHRLIKLINESLVKKKEILRLSTNPSSSFINEFNKLDFDKDLEYLLTTDLLLSTDVFQFRNTFSKAEKKEDRINTFYKLSVNVFFNSTTRQTSKGGKKVTYYEVTSLDLKNIPNLLYKPQPEVTL